MRVAALVLAAGASTRLGRPKQLVQYGGEPLVRRAAQAACVVGADPVLVILGAHADAIAPALDGVHATVVVHAGWRDGLATSLAAGLRALDTATQQDKRAPPDGVLLTVCDQPLIDAEALSRLLAAFRGSNALVAAEYDGTLGVPAIIGRAHLGALAALVGDQGAGRWLRARAAQVTAVSIPEAAIDVDTAADVASIENDSELQA